MKDRPDLILWIISALILAMLVVGILQDPGDAEDPRDALRDGAEGTTDAVGTQHG